MTFTLGAALLVGAVVLFVLQPLFTGRGSSLGRTEDEMTEAEARRRVTLLALRDVEYDFHTGKLDETDYRDLRKELSAEALQALEEVEREGESRDAIQDLEAEIARVREGLREGLTCPACGHTNREGSRFCSACGGELGAGTHAVG